MTLNPQRQIQLREKRRKKGLAIDTDEEELAFPLSAKMESGAYTTTFNSYVNNLKRKEYKTKNPRLFTWNIRPQYMNKLSFMPDSALSVTSRLGVETSREDALSFDSPRVRKPARHLTKTKVKSQQSNLDMDVRFKSVTDREKLVDLDWEKLEAFYKEANHYVKPTYGVAKLQTDLLTNRSETVSSQIPNFKYMLNHFNKRNQAINKIISQVKADERQLNKDDIIKEVKTKIDIASRPVTFNQYFRPTTTTDFRIQGSPSNRFNRRRVHTESRENSKNNTHEATFPMKQSGQKKGLDLNLESVGPSIESEANNLKGSVTTRERQLTRLPTTRLKKDYSKDSTQSQMMKKESDTQRLREEDRAYVKGLEYGLKQLEVLSQKKQRKKSISPNARLHATTFDFKPALARAGTTMWQRKTEEDEIFDRVTKKVDDDNILYFSKYFKKKYMESGLSLEMSPKLKSSLKNLDKEIKKSIKNIKLIDVKQIQS